MTRTARYFVFAAVALLALVGGYLAQVWRDETEPRPDPGEVLLAASLDDLAGTSQALSQWRGRVLVVNFWATWCPPCLKEIPEFVRVQTRYAEKGVQFVGIAIDDPGRVAAFVSRHGVNYPILMAEKEGLTLSRNAGNRLGGLPFTVVIDRAGRSALVARGELNEEKLVPVLESLL